MIKTIEKRSGSLKIKLLIIFCSLGIMATGQIKLPRLISDNMVLQRDANLTIWGWAAAGEKVSLKFKEKTYTTTAGADSTWERD